MSLATIMPPEGMELVYSRPQALTDTHTHYCPGCTHGVAHRLLAEALDELGLSHALRQSLEELKTLYGGQESAAAADEPVKEATKGEEAAADEEAKDTEE